MSITVKFIILYLIPILTFIASFGIYLHAYGKSSEETYINAGFLFIICALVASSLLAFNICHHFSINQSNPLGFIFSVIGWIAAILVTLLYLVVFYGMFNPWSWKYKMVRPFDKNYFEKNRWWCYESLLC